VLVAVEVGGGAEAGHVEGDGGAPSLSQPVEYQPPGVGAVGVAVQEQQRDPLAVELQRPRLEASQLQPVLVDRLHWLRSQEAITPRG
jgi:hypothetical protein